MVDEASPSDRPTLSAIPPATRERLGRYALGRSLGRGGMGEVFRARAFGAEGVVKELCVKRIRTERLARPGALAQFIAEARLWARLHHGNIVTVFDFGRAGAEYYLAMEWVDGADVRALLDDARTSGEPLPASTAAHVAAEVARALAYAHAVRDEHGHGVIHRDVKPANILVSRSGDVRLTDFGVAAVAFDAARSGLGTERPEERPRAGTPAYMAPEQRRGEATDARADLYALGVVLHELLAGARPVDGMLALPSTTPQDVADVVAALLRENVDGRPASAADVARSLEAAVGRARARGDEPAPRDELGRRAARVADRQQERSEEPRVELAADASFVDSGPEELPSVTHSTVTDAPYVTGKRKALAAARTERTTARRAAAAVLMMITLAAVALGVYSGFGADPVTAPAGDASESQARLSAERERGRARPESTATTAGIDTTAPAPSPRPRGEGRGEDSAAPTAEPPAPIAVAATPPPRAGAPHGTGRAPHEPVNHPPPPADPALLNVNATPWAAVWVDGTSRGTTPLFGVSLSPGRHVLRFVNAPLGVERETTVTLASGERRDLVVDLSPADAPAVAQVAREQ